MIRFVVRGKKKVKVMGLKYLSSDGSPMALGSTEPHEVRVKLMNPHQGLTPLTELKLTKSTVSGETLFGKSF